MHSGDNSPLNSNIFFAFLNGILDIASTDAGLSIFIECLRYLRDTHILAKKSEISIASLNAAIEELDAYNKTKKDFHWNNFCEFIKLNLEEWLVLNDTV